MLAGPTRGLEKFGGPTCNCRRGGLSTSPSSPPASTRREGKPRDRGCGRADESTRRIHPALECIQNLQPLSCGLMHEIRMHQAGQSRASGVQLRQATAVSSPDNPSVRQGSDAVFFHASVSSCATRGHREYVPCRIGRHGKGTWRARRVVLVCKAAGFPAVIV